MSRLTHRDYWDALPDLSRQAIYGAYRETKQQDQQQLADKTKHGTSLTDSQEINHE